MTPTTPELCHFSPARIDHGSSSTMLRMFGSSKSNMPSIFIRISQSVSIQTVLCAGHFIIDNGFLNQPFSSVFVISIMA